MSVVVSDRRRIPFFMVGKPDLALLAEICDARMLPYARSVYCALLELANDQRRDEIAASRSELARRAGVSVPTLKRCASVLRDAGLVTMREVPGYPNVWTLLGADEGGSSGTGGRVSQNRGAGLTEPPLKETVVKEEKKEEVESATHSRQPDPVKQVWAHYQETMPNGKRCQLSPARKLLIRTALKVRSEEECKLAITALSQSDYHVQGGYLDLRYALRGGGRSPDPEATIDRLIAQAANGSGRANGNGNGRSVFDGKVWPGGRTFGDLTPGEQASAREAVMMGLRPWEAGRDAAPVTPSGHAITGKSLAAEILAGQAGQAAGGGSVRSGSDHGGP